MLRFGSNPAKVNISESAMPSAKLICPHCETPVEIQVLEVTRSRPCPKCGKQIMLQVAGREANVKHKALLVAPTHSAPTNDLNHEPQPLPGDAFDRMCSDPEILKMRRNFVIAVSTVIGLIITATILQWSGFWRKTQTNDPVYAGSFQPLVTASEKPDKPAPVKAKLRKVTQPTQAIKKLTFHGAEDHPEDTSTVAEARLALEKFLATNSVEERLALVCNPETVETPLRDYYTHHPVEAVSFEQIEYGFKSSENFTEFRVLLKDGTKQFAAVVPTPNGPKVDWPSFVALGDLDWEQMRQKRPTTPVLMRVLAAPAANFTGHFSDADSLRCVQLVPAGNPSAPPIYGYVPRGNDLDRQLDNLLRSSGGESAPLTVKLCYSAETIGNDQVWLTELVTSGWVTASVTKGSEGE